MLLLDAFIGLLDKIKEHFQGFVEPHGHTYQYKHSMPGFRLIFTLASLGSVELGSGIIFHLSGRGPFLFGFRPFHGFPLLLFAASFAASFLWF